MDGTRDHRELILGTERMRSRLCDMSEPRDDHTCLFATPWAVACQTPLSMGFPRQEYWSGFPCPPPGDLPHPGIKPASLMSLASAGIFFFLPLALFEKAKDVEILAIMITNPRH